MQRSRPHGRTSVNTFWRSVDMHAPRFILAAHLDSPREHRDLEANIMARADQNHQVDQCQRARKQSCEGAKTSQWLTMHSVSNSASARLLPQLHGTVPTKLLGMVGKGRSVQSRRDGTVLTTCGAQRACCVLGSGVSIRDDMGCRLVQMRPMHATICVRHSTTYVRTSGSLE